jgi:hypothetical protein
VSGAVSHKQAARLGWQRVDNRAAGKVGAEWRHRDGWRLEHCGHPTALWPWLLVSPAGDVHCTGGAYHDDPTVGFAWPTLAEAMTYVRRVEAGLLPMRAGRTDVVGVQS